MELVGQPIDLFKDNLNEWERLMIAKKSYKIQEDDLEQVVDTIRFQRGETIKQPAGFGVGGKKKGDGGGEDEGMEDGEYIETRVPINNPRRALKVRKTGSAHIKEFGEAGITPTDAEAKARVLQARKEERQGQTPRALKLPAVGKKGKK